MEVDYFNNWLDRNGSIHIQQVRYSFGKERFYCLGIDDFADFEKCIDMFWDLVGGDIDYFNATEFFHNNKYCFLVTGDTPELALEKCKGEVVKWMNS